MTERERLIVRLVESALKMEEYPPYKEYIIPLPPRTAHFTGTLETAPMQETIKIPKSVLRNLALNFIGLYRQFLEDENREGTEDE